MKSFDNVLILGDSYSTFEGCIPENYAIYYSKETENSDVCKVEHTWWHSLFSETNSNLIHNNSWSGSTICYTGYGNIDCSKTNSFIFRLNQLIENGFFNENEINTVFIFGGTNDTWANAPIGELKFSDWSKEELHAALPAFCCLMNKIKETVPKAQIYWLINTELKPEIVDGMIKACEYYHIDFIKFETIDKTAGHPTIKGMQDIKNQIIEYIEK